ncbi:MarR family winged helix-turn-helix transcriptional regulator [Roseateles toxinivorans]|uniref:MarR family transcriptional regulator n=1 Tax=Roseateles toxinivorans TaxID=270368 RepID=A0A4R6QH05_9BURK|nr:MarR family winged helix-turn-helix transcriptional regulator [Roseateles toxinivorans]TDP61861.1 MarR family transcriptional regulator [Roseateles toxinivorans]
MTSPPRAAAPVGCTNLKLRQLTRRVGQHYDHIVGAAGVKTTQYSLLSYIVKLAPVRPSDLAKVMEMEASTLTRNLQPLVAAGWVVIGPGVDGRSRVVTATDTGRAKRAEAQAEWKRAQQALNERLGVDKVLQLHALLDECLGLMSDTSGECDD